MDVKFTCRRCHQESLANVENTGEQIDCPSCGNAIVIPGAEPVMRPDKPTFKRTEPGVQPSIMPTPAKRPGVLLIKCPGCAREVSSQAMSCPGCGHPFPQNQAEQYNQSPQAQNLGCLSSIALFMVVFIVLFCLRGC